MIQKLIKYAAIAGAFFFLYAFFDEKLQAHDVAPIFLIGSYLVALYAIYDVFVKPAIEYIKKQKIKADELINGQKLKMHEEEMLRIKQLLDAGLITQEEFDDRLKKLKE